MNRSEKTLLAFILGATAGLAAGFLFAPAKGEKTRQAISDKAAGLKEDLKENLDQGKLKGLASSARAEIDKYRERVSEAVKN